MKKIRRPGIYWNPNNKISVLSIAWKTTIQNPSLIVWPVLTSFLPTVFLIITAIFLIPAIPALLHSDLTKIPTQFAFMLPIFIFTISALTTKTIVDSVYASKIKNILKRKKNTFDDLPIFLPDALAYRILTMMISLGISIIVTAGIIAIALLLINNTLDWYVAIIGIATTLTAMTSLSVAYSILKKLTWAAIFIDYKTLPRAILAAACELANNWRLFIPAWILIAIFTLTLSATRTLGQYTLTEIPEFGIYAALTFISLYSLLLNLFENFLWFALYSFRTKQSPEKTKHTKSIFKLIPKLSPLNIQNNGFRKTDTKNTVVNEQNIIPFDSLLSKK